MCFDFDAHPPELPADLRRPPIAGGAAAESLVLEAADGNRFAAALAGADSEVGVVILPDVRGLYRFYSELAERLAEAGHPAIALDYFGRTAGAQERGEDFDFWPEVIQTTPGGVQTDAAAARAALLEHSSAQRAVTLGFCFGGSMAYLAATRSDLGFEGTIAFYGALAPRRAGMPDVLAHAGDMEGPILGLFGGADEAIPVEQVTEFDERLTGAGTEHAIHVYPGAPHSFFDRSYEEHSAACEDAWRRVLAFLGRL